MDAVKTILLVDDSRDEYSFFKIALAKIERKVTLMHAWDGDECLDLLQTQEHLPDIIFLDINMPRMSGLECLVALKKQERTKYIPVVIYSTTKREREIKMAKEFGALWFLSKPPLHLLPDALRHIFGETGSKPAGITIRKFDEGISNQPVS